LRSVVGDDLQESWLNFYGSVGEGCEKIEIDEDHLVSALEIWFDNEDYGVFGMVIEVSPTWLLEDELNRLQMVERGSEEWLENT
jgi:hypothetical protein